jgi:hypothetical protein
LIWQENYCDQRQYADYESERDKQQWPTKDRVGNLSSRTGVEMIQPRQSSMWLQSYVK